jgi:hypothetical protein
MRWRARISSSTRRPQSPPRLIENQRHTFFGDYDRWRIGVGRGYCWHHRGVDDAQSCETANARVTPARCRALRSFRRQYGDRLDLEKKVVARELTHLHRG